MAKVVGCHFAKPGKHGSGKKIVTGIDIISGAKYVETFKDKDTFLPFDVSTATYQIVDVDDENYVTLLDSEGELKRDFYQLSDLEASTVLEILDRDEECEITFTKVVVDDDVSLRVSSIKKLQG